MKKPLALRGALLVLPLLWSPVSRVDAQAARASPPPDELFRTMTSLDSALFDAFNRCDLEKFSSFSVDDVDRFHHPKAEDTEPVGEAKFVHLWQNKDGAWKITRVLSYDHHAVSR